MKLDMIGLTCADLARSFVFYGLCGLPTEGLSPAEPYSEVVLPGGIRLSFNSLEMMREIDPHWQPPVGQRIALAFLCESPAAVDATHKRITDAGFRSVRTPWDAFWGQRYAQVEDPDGNVIDLFAPIAG